MINSKVVDFKKINYWLSQFDCSFLFLAVILNKLSKVKGIYYYAKFSIIFQDFSILYEITFFLFLALWRRILSADSELKSDGVNFKRSRHFSL